MGVQMLAAALVAWRLRGNVVASLLPVWITNPVTVVPIYYLCNRTGAPIAGKPVSLRKLRYVLGKVREMDFLDGTRYLFTELFDALVATAIGGVILGLITAIPCYAMVKLAVGSYQRIRMERRLRWLGIVEPPRPADVHPVPVEEATPNDPDDPRSRVP